jgi:hypothetical protein
VYCALRWSIDEIIRIEEAKIVQATVQRPLSRWPLLLADPVAPLHSDARSSSHIARRCVRNLLSYPQARVCFRGDRKVRRSGNALAVRDKVYLKAYCMFKLDSNLETVVMAGEVKGEMAVAQFRSPVEARADIAGSPREDKMPPAGSSKGTQTPSPPQIQLLCLQSNIFVIYRVSSGWAVAVGESV